MPTQHQKRYSDIGLNEYYRRIIRLAIVNKPMYLAWKVLCIHRENLYPTMGYPLYCILAGEEYGSPTGTPRENKNPRENALGIFSH